MKQRPRLYYSESQRALMWERWRKAIRAIKSTNCSIATPFGAGYSDADRRRSTRTALPIGIGALPLPGARRYRAFPRRQASRCLAMDYLLMCRLTAERTDGGSLKKMLRKRR
jgi:hypothetical protein